MGGCPVELPLGLDDTLTPALFRTSFNQEAMHAQAAIVLDRDLNDWLPIGPWATINLSSAHNLETTYSTSKRACIQRSGLIHMPPCPRQRHPQIPRGSESKSVLSLGFHFSPVLTLSGTLIKH